MNRTKTIYFLSAIVLIIGCYALNLSYSLFVQTENRDVVNLSVPSLAYSLETSAYTIPASSGELIKLKVINSGTADINYGVSTNQVDGITVQLVEKTDNSIIGTLEASNTNGESSNKEVWLYVTNSNEIDTDITFNLTAKYTTLNFDENFASTSNIDIENLYKLKYLNETLIASAQEAAENNDATRTLYNDTFNLNSINGASSETDRMLALAEDDYGTSYVYRGAVKDNYVKFAGFIWRVVRINGDQSVRLILEGTLDKVKREGLNMYAGSTSVFKSSPYSDNAYVGYMYGLAGTLNDANRCLILVDGTVTDKMSDYSTKELCEQNGGKWTTTAYEATHTNVGSSTIKTNIDIFYETYIENETNNYRYKQYLADNIFCGDKTLAKNGIGNVTTQLGYGTGNSYKTYYGAMDRLYYSSGTTSITEATPTLKCAIGASNDYSRYTVSAQTINGVSTNGDLKYPIGLLSADELVMAGAFKSKGNKTYYLYDAYKNDLSDTNFITISPASFGGVDANLFFSSTTNYSISTNSVQTTFGIRPIINLKKEVFINGGDGTESNPYVVIGI